MWRWLTSASCPVPCGSFWPQWLGWGSPLAPLLSALPGDQDCTGASSSYPGGLRGSARDWLQGCDLVQVILTEKSCFPAGTHGTITVAPWSELSAGGAAPAPRIFSSPPRPPPAAASPRPTNAVCKAFAPRGASASTGVPCSGDLKSSHPPMPGILPGEGAGRNGARAQGLLECTAKPYLEAKAGVGLRQRL